MFKALFSRKDKPIKFGVVIEQEDYYLSVKAINNGKRLAFITCVIEDDNRIMIGDIQHDGSNNYNMGLGSVMMEKLIEYANNNSYIELYGNLSIVDLNHKNRLHHFYNKFDFEIIEYPEVKDMYYGEVRRKI
ncbi:GNAT family N-acetyltransferase [Ruminococcus flavefaciens]|uniref:GNAT family N-acetyltransferase n=1 Tax=Ruminococcus flavefaciens TaxID=1265 RepID=UPI0026E933E2|nr:GNAT family N-acetyltransferase [Ruminococcus flavefaciens]